MRALRRFLELFLQPGDPILDAEGLPHFCTCCTNVGADEAPENAPAGMSLPPISRPPHKRSPDDEGVVTERIASLALILMALLLRALVASHGYSGYGKPPLHGDYEAQRHWMETTVHLPMGEWYHHTQENDLDYWGLDYPPLTAYHSWLCGKIAEAVGVGELVAWKSSRGIETPNTKVFMRWTAILSDLCFFIPPILLFCRWAYVYYYQTAVPLELQLLRDKHKTRASSAPPQDDTTTGQSTTPQYRRSNGPFINYASIVMMLLFHPSFVLVDHGHFQYNGVSLGLALLGITFVVLFDDPTSFQHWLCELLGSVCFTLSMCFKQMSLYYAPAFFVYLLGRSLQQKGLLRKLVRVAALGVVVLGTFAACFAPIVTSDPPPATALVPNSPYELDVPSQWPTWLQQTAQVLHRLFPFQRGLFEDKVANFWCVSSLAIKWHRIFSVPTMARISLVATLLSMLPFCVHTVLKPSRRSFLYCIIGCALSFFLFSFQVHEKTILLPLLPLSLLIGECPFTSLVTWMGIISTASMYPLLQRDGLAVPYLVCQLLFLWLSSAAPAADCPLLAPENRKNGFGRWSWKGMILVSPLHAGVGEWYPSPLMYRFHHVIQLMRSISLVGLLAIHGVALAVTKDTFPKYPDLVPLLFAVYSCAHFVALWLGICVLQWSLSQERHPSNVAAKKDQ